MKTESIVLIGMAGAGKSTVGRLVARTLGFRFIDGDDYICEKDGRPLQDIIDIGGEDAFLELEKRLIYEIDLASHVVLAPGGSVIYHPDLMEYLKENSVLVYLDDSFENIESRLTNVSRRGIIGLKTKSLRQIYDERKPLYCKWADIILYCTARKPDDLAAEVLRQYRSMKKQEDF
jgi:shikimate kinase